MSKLSLKDKEKIYNEMLMLIERIRTDLADHDDEADYEFIEELDILIDKAKGVSK